jgi:ankyrin repeat protein
MTGGSPFSRAVEAIAGGDEPGLHALLRAHPGLIRERAAFPHQATLLHYVGANGVEVQRSPGNAAAIARILLEAGAEADAEAPIYGAADTTLCMTVTSVHPYLAGVQASLVDTLVDYGAKVDGVAGDGAPLGCALLFGYTEAAERLVLRGARVDNLIYAAGLGRADVVRQMLATGTGTDRIVRRTDDRAGRFSYPVPRDADSRVVALIVAAMHGRRSTVGALLDGGVDVNAPYCGQSALHFAAYTGRAEVVEELLARGADTSGAADVLRQIDDLREKIEKMKQRKQP